MDAVVTFKMTPRELDIVRAALRTFAVGQFSGAQVAGINAKTKRQLQADAMAANKLLEALGGDRV